MKQRNQRRSRNHPVSPKGVSKRQHDSISIDRWNEQLAEMSLETSERMGGPSPGIRSPSELTEGGNSVTKMQAMMIRSNE